jgi:hypothetical protein
MGVRSEGNGHRDVWKLLIGLSVVCAVLVFVGGFLHRRALESAVADRQAKSVALVNAKVADAAEHTDLSKPLKDPAAAHLTKQLNLPAGTDLRLFSGAGGVLYSSPGLSSFPADAEGLQTAASGDPAHVVDDADLRVYVPVDGKGAKPVAVAAVVSNYTQLRDDAAGPLDGVRLPIVALGVVLLVVGLLLMLQATKGAAAEKAPAAGPQPTAAPEAKASKGKASSGKRRVTGFDPVPVTSGPAIQRVEVEDEPASASAAAAAAAAEVAPEPPAQVAPPVAEAPAAKTVFGLRLPSKKPKQQDAAPEAPTAAVEPEPAAPKAKRSLFARKEAAPELAAAADVPSDKATSALDREIAIREALEDQLEQLRTRMRTQDLEAANTKKELLAEIEAANARAEEAEARARDAGAAPAAIPAPEPAGVPARQAETPPPVAAPDETAMRVQQLEREIAEARSVSTDAVARAEALQRQLDEAKAAPAADPASAAKLAEATAQLADAQQRASAAEQRAASIESVRDELEVRVAQLGTKASELEQRATELETSLNEANAGGDAVRAEIATLTAALAAANARATELETASAATPVRNEDDQAEIARLRGELANHMERAKAAEDRAATLEADLAASDHDLVSHPDAATDVPSMDDAASTPVVENDRLASRFEETSEADEQKAEPVAPREPEAREPEVREPQVELPETSEAAREPEHSVSKVVAAPPDAQATPSLQGASTFNSVIASGSSTSSASDSNEVDPSDGARGIEQASVPVEPVPAIAASWEQPRDEAVHREPASQTGAVPEPEASEAVPEPEAPVSAAAPEPEAPLETPPAQQDHVEKTPAVEWHAPAPAHQTTQPAASSHGSIPPAPSSDARYDDMWTAAFSDPKPEPAPASTEVAATENDEADAGSSSATDPETTAPQTRAPEAAVSPEDQPSPPEDDLSAEDDMWSLRARLEAASRKQTHDID